MLPPNQVGLHRRTLTFRFLQGAVIAVALFKACAQVAPFQVTRESRLNFGGSEQLYSAISFAGGNVLVGATEVPLFGGSILYPWLIRQTSLGEVVWRREPGPKLSQPVLATASDGSFFLVTSGFLIQKLAGSGEILWEINEGSGTSPAVIGDFEGGCVVAAGINQPGRRRDLRVVAIDKSGVIRWESILGGDGDDDYPKLALGPEGGVYLAASTDSPASGDISTAPYGNWDGWLARLDAKGSILWQYRLGGSQSDFISTLQSSPSGCWIGMGSLSGFDGNKPNNTFGNEDWWIARFNVAGDLLWQSCYGGADQDRPMAMVVRTDDRVAIAGISSSPISGNKHAKRRGKDADTWVVEVDSHGQILWQQTYSGPRSQIPYLIEPTPEQGLTIIGVRDQSDLLSFSIGPETTPASQEVHLWRLEEYTPSETLSLSGPVGQPFRLMSSRNLREWQTENRGVFATVDTKIKIKPASENIYYRIDVE